MRHCQRKCRIFKTITTTNYNLQTFRKIKQSSHKFFPQNTKVQLP